MPVLGVPATSLSRLDSTKVVLVGPALMGPLPKG